MAKRAFRRTILGILLLLSFQVSAGPIISVSSEAFDDNNFVPALGTYNASNGRYEIWDGDFLVWLPYDQILGDGISENHDWFVDFRSHANWTDFSHINKITSASLTLTLTPTSGVGNDALSVFFPGHAILRPTEIQSLTPGVTATIHIDLLDYYSADEMLYAALGLSTPGRFRMGESNSVTIEYARVDFQGAQVSEPPTSALLFLGVAGIGYLRRREAT